MQETIIKHLKQMFFLKHFSPKFKSMTGNLDGKKDIPKKTLVKFLNLREKITFLLAEIRSYIKGEN